MSTANAPTSALVATARTVEWSTGLELAAELSAAADARTRYLVEGFVHQAGPPPDRFAWVALGSHARRELHCASDQDHALIWRSARAAASGYAQDLASHVIAGLADFGMRRCDGGYMADRWSLGIDDWIEATWARIEAPTPQAVLDTDVFLDVRAVVADLDLAAVSAQLLAGADSPRLLHGLARAATSFAPALNRLGRLPGGSVDLKRGGLAPLVLLARLYGLQARTAAVTTPDRLAAARDRGLLSAELSDRLGAGFATLVALRLTRQLADVAAGSPLSDSVRVGDLSDAERTALLEALRAVRSAQAAAALVFRTDL